MFYMSLDLMYKIRMIQAVACTTGAILNGENAFKISLDLMRISILEITTVNILTCNIFYPCLGCKTSSPRSGLTCIRSAKEVQKRHCVVLLCGTTHTPEPEAFFSDVSLSWFTQGSRRIFF